MHACLWLILRKRDFAKQYFSQATEVEMYVCGLAITASNNLSIDMFIKHREGVAFVAQTFGFAYISPRAPP